MEKKKIWGAILSGGAFILYLSFFLYLIFFFEVDSTEKLPVGLFIFLIIILSIPLIGIVASLVSRIREIKGGEEEEAKKY